MHADRQVSFTERDIEQILRERQIETRNARNLSLWLQKYYYQPGKWMQVKVDENYYEVPAKFRRTAI